MKTSILVAALVVAASSASTYAQGVPELRPGPSAPVSVTNTATDPVPVAGTVQVGNASSNPVPVTGTVQVGNGPLSPIPVTGAVNAQVQGAVDVTSMPASVTSRLDQIITSLQSLVTSAGTNAVPAANFARSYFWATDEHVRRDFGRDVLVSSVIVSAENDDGVLFLCPTIAADCAGTGNDYLAIGSANREFPGVLVVPFPQPVRLRSLYWLCLNTVEMCEVTVNVVGTAAP